MKMCVVREGINNQNHFPKHSASFSSYFSDALAFCCMVLSGNIEFSLIKFDFSILNLIINVFFN